MTDEELRVVADGTVSDATKVLKQQDKKKEDAIIRDEEKLHGARRTFHSYNELLAMFLIRELQSIDWKGFTYEVAPTEKGVVMELTSPSFRYFRLAFASTGLEKFDRAAVDSFVVRAEETVEKYSGSSLQY